MLFFHNFHCVYFVRVLIYDHLNSFLDYYGDEIFVENIY